MNVLVDFTQVPLQRTGVGAYAENLVRQLPSLLHPDEQLFLLLQSDEESVPRSLAGRDNVHFIRVPSRVFRNRMLLMLFEQTVLPVIAATRRIDVLHSLHYTLPLWASAARVVTFHDLTMLLWPRLHTLGRRAIFPTYMRFAWKRADAILFVSESTRRDAERLFPPSSKIRAVAPLGIGSEADIPIPAAGISEELGKLHLSRPWLLFVGTIEPRKNLVVLIQAFDRIAGQFPDCTLVLAGKLGWNYEPTLRAMAASPFRERIRHLGYVSDQTRRCLLAGCSALVYPSLYEGFGLPVLEGMAAGAPVVTSNISSLPEIAGEAALLISPESVDELAGALRKVLTGGLAQELRERGPKQAALFTWRRTAAETLAVYRAVCQARRDSARRGKPGR
ncbi:MAG TPA: glycosyltransferase family 1 protein [Acidobacteriaceae bacterium]|nr:glycosyltransferase family 1 protein [Acidobacteriaceae bacterium]